MLLGFIEQQPLYDQYNFSAKIDEPAALPPRQKNNGQVVATRIENLICPSSARLPDLTQHPNVTGVSFSKGNIALNQGERIGGRAGDQNSADLSGPFHATGYRSGEFDSSPYGASMNEFIDGTANTIILGEILGSTDSDDSRGAWGLAMAATFNGNIRYIPLANTGNIDTCTPNDQTAAQTPRTNMTGPDACTDQPLFCGTAAMNIMNAKEIYCSVSAASMQSSQSTVASPNTSPGHVARSKHTAGVNVAMADASTRFVNNNVPVGAWRAALTHMGGERDQLTGNK
jgi:hypothetical protein